MKTLCRDGATLHQHFNLIRSTRLRGTTTSRVHPHPAQVPAVEEKPAAAQVPAVEEKPAAAQVPAVEEKPAAAQVPAVEAGSQSPSPSATDSSASSPAVSSSSAPLTISSWCFESLRDLILFYSL
ncbi:nischarin-like isoform X2 [Silurus meridionalis]|uniref:nischarin-like isoform X2 n=1 Tax=Silurus meridionalis TaxID=175797 RepID=UPI001EEAD044|nr:nischarin-like isoform X2 [Silurus meridionalis]